LLTVVPEASPQLARWVDRALAFKNHDRWPTAKAMLDALRPLLEEEVRRDPNQPSRAPRKIGLEAFTERVKRLPSLLRSIFLRTLAHRRLSLALLGIAMVALCGAVWACGRPSSSRANSLVQQARRPTASEPAVRIHRQVSMLEHIGRGRRSL